MASFIRFATSRLPLAFGVLGVWFAVARWCWYHTLPRYAPARFCGNCFLAAVGMPTELGLLGLLLACFSLLKIPYCGRNLVYWCCAAVGVLLTPVEIGVLLFAFAFLMLMLPIPSALFKAAVRVEFRL